MRIALKFLTIYAAIVMMTPSAFAQSHGITPEDYFAFKFLNDVRFSPDTIAFMVGTIDQKRNRRYNAIWTIPADGSLQCTFDQPAMEPGRTLNSCTPFTATSKSDRGSRLVRGQAETSWVWSVAYQSSRA